MSKSVGVYIGQDEVIAVSVISTITGPQIKSFVIEPMVAGPEETPVKGKHAPKEKTLSPEAQAIRNALKKIQEPGAYVTVAFSPSFYVTRHFIMPAIPNKEKDAAIRYEASRYIPFKLSECVLDYSVCETHKNVLAVTVTAIQKETLAIYMRHLRGAGAKVATVEPAFLAVSRALNPLNPVSGTKTHGFVIIQSDGNVNITLATKGAVALSRDFLLTGKPEEDKPRFHEELKASLDYFYNSTGGEAVEQIFLVGHADLQLWAEYLEQVFNYKVRFDKASIASAKNLAPDVISAIFIPYGLALRAMNFKAPLGTMMLLPKEDRRSTLDQMLKFIGFEVLAIFLLFLVVRFAIFQPYLAHLGAENDRIFSSDAAADPRASSQSLEDLKKIVSDLKSRSAQLNSFLDDRISSESILRALGQGLPTSIWLDYIALEDSAKEGGAKGKAKKRLSLKGVCFLGNLEKETETVNNWVKGFSAKSVFSKIFSEMKLEEVKRERFLNRDTTRFRVVCE